MSGADGTVKTVLVLAGEVSGDHHASAVVRALSIRHPELRFIGLGGAELQDAGVELIEDFDRLNVMGIAEVLRQLPFFLKLGRRVEALMDQGVDLVLAVDYPGFNMRMAKAAKARGIPVLYYIAPQVWAWKAHRAAKLAHDVSEIAVILPFEEAVFNREGGSATYVGHPLMDRPPLQVDEAELRADLGVGDAPILALLPGSRRQELSRHLELFAQVGAAVQQRHPEVRPVIAAAPGVDCGPLEATGYPVTLRTRELLRISHVALVKSGTSTLDAAIAGVPFLMAYRSSALTWMVAKRVVKVDHIALANLVVDRRVIPEFMQGAAEPEAMAEALSGLIPQDSAARRTMLTDIAEIRAALGGPGAADRVADLADRLLGFDIAHAASDDPVRDDTLSDDTGGGSA